jgi:pyruvate formate lyase activating enzyme
MLDIKYATDKLYKEYVGCSIDTPLEFLKYLSEQNIPTCIRQVTVPTINDNEADIDALYEIIKDYKIDKVELLPFKKICQVKYDKLNIPFKFGSLPEPTNELMQKLNGILEND